MYGFLFILALLFVAYALYAHYHDTPVGDPILKRVITAIGLAAAAGGAAIMSWFHS